MALSELGVVVAALRAGFTPPLVLVPEIGDALKPLVEIASPGNIAKLFGDLMCSATVDYGPFKADAPEATAARWAATRGLVLQVLEAQIAAYKQAMEAGAVAEDDAAYSALLGAMRAINGLREKVFKPAQATKEVRKYVAAWGSPAQLARRDSVGGGLLAAPGHTAKLHRG